MALPIPVERPANNVSPNANAICSNVKSIIANIVLSFEFLSFQHNLAQ
jgi:hypothetical protein